MGVLGVGSNGDGDVEGKCGSGCVGVRLLRWVWEYWICLSNSAEGFKKDASIRVSGLWLCGCMVSRYWWSGSVIGVEVEVEGGVDMEVGVGVGLAGVSVSVECGGVALLEGAGRAGPSQKLNLGTKLPAAKHSLSSGTEIARGGVGSQDASVGPLHAGGLARWASRRLPPFIPWGSGASGALRGADILDVSASGAAWIPRW